MKEEEEEEEEEVWIAAWTSAVSSGRCFDKHIATKWADSCLADFKERFSTKAKTTSHKERVAKQLKDK